jgi:hypothetical protein
VYLVPCDIKKVLIGRQDGMDLGFTIQGLPRTFPSKQGVEGQNNRKWSQVSQIGDIEEKRHSEEEVARIMEGLQDSFRENENLPLDTICNISESAFRIDLKDGISAFHIDLKDGITSVFTKQYAIPWKTIPKVMKRVQEWVDVGWVENAD